MQALLVAGGYLPGDDSTTTSVLTLTPGGETWTSLASLPKAVAQGQASILGGRVRLNGGSGRSEVMMEITKIDNNGSHHKIKSL